MPARSEAPPEPLGLPDRWQIDWAALDRRHSLQANPNLLPSWPWLEKSTKSF
jgi:hypothetical protein